LIYILLSIDAPSAPLFRRRIMIYRHRARLRRSRGHFISQYAPALLFRNDATRRRAAPHLSTIFFADRCDSSSPARYEVTADVGQLRFAEIFSGFNAATPREAVLASPVGRMRWHNMPGRMSSHLA
jgi:hypothetical protein